MALPARSAAPVAVLVTVLVVLLAGCAASPAPAPTGPCPRTPPSRDPTQPVSTCGVAGTDLTVPITRHADLLPVTVELYEGRDLTCAGPCAIGDDRDHLTAPTAAPAIDPSRRRALLTLDWADDRAALHVDPRCVLVAAAMQQCTPVGGAGFTLTADPGATAPWHLRLALTIPGDPSGAPTPATTDHWDIALDPAAARMTLTGDGTGTPDVAVVSQGSVVCDAPGAPPPHPPTPESVQHYACTVTLPANP